MLIIMKFLRCMLRNAQQPSWNSASSIVKSRRYLVCSLFRLFSFFLFSQDRIKMLVCVYFYCTHRATTKYPRSNYRNNDSVARWYTSIYSHTETSMNFLAFFYFNRPCFCRLLGRLHEILLHNYTHLFIRHIFLFHSCLFPFYKWNKVFGLLPVTCQSTCIFSSCKNTFVWFLDIPSVS